MRLLLLHCLLSLVSAWVQQQLLRPLLRVPHQQQQQHAGTTTTNNNNNRRTVVRLAAAEIIASTGDGSSSSSSSNVRLQEEGSELIRRAAIEAGCRSDQIVGIQWKPGRVVVTISGNTYVRDDQAEEDAVNSSEFEGGDVDGDTPMQPQHGVNLVQVSRAIHDALDMNQEDSIGYQIGLNYEIEVTTPGAPDELSGIMFQSYRGFDVLVDFTDPKTKKRKTIEGRLVERNDDFTVINFKGRMKSIRNDMVESVKLPKAKKEKNSR